MLHQHDVEVIIRAAWQLWSWIFEVFVQTRVKLWKIVFFCIAYYNESFNHINWVNAVLKFVQRSTPNIATPMSIIAIWHTVCILYVFNINTTLDVTNLGTNRVLFFACGLLSRANSTHWQHGSWDVCQLAVLFGPDWIILTAIGHIAMTFPTDIHGCFGMNPTPTFEIPSLVLAPPAGWNWYVFLKCIYLFFVKFLDSCFYI